MIKIKPLSSPYNASPPLVRYPSMASQPRNINNLAHECGFDRLDLMTDIGMRYASVESVDGIPLAHLPALDRWAIDLGQRAARYREPTQIAAGESPRA